MTCDSLARASTPRTTSVLAPCGAASEVAGKASASPPATAIAVRIMPRLSSFQMESEGGPSLAFPVFRSEIPFDFGEEIPANDAINFLIPINLRHMHTEERRLGKKCVKTV